MENRFSINESLWVCRSRRIQEVVYPRVETAALQARGAQVFLLDETSSTNGIEELRRLLWKSDVHVVFMWLFPYQIKLLYPILRERKNFSMVLDDWWFCPPWFMREAKYIIFRMYNGIATRLGHAPLVTTAPPLLVKPEPLSAYGVTASLLRLPVLATWPFVDAYRWMRRRGQVVHPERLLYLPLSVIPETLPLQRRKN